MSKTHPNQRSFSQGELSPLMYGRTELEMYAAGTKVMHNMTADSRGPAVWRNGMKFVTSFAGTDARLETIRLDKNQFATLVFLDLEIKILRGVDNPLIETIASPWTKDQIGEVQIIPLPDGKTIYFTHPRVQPQKLTFVDSLVNSQEFLADGSFTVPAGVTSVNVCAAGGGGGAGGGVTAGSPYIVGGGGGGGAGAPTVTITVTPAETINIVIGNGGAGGSFGYDGGDGSDTVITYSGGTITALGGKGGKKGFATSDVDATSGIAAGGSGGGNGGVGAVFGERPSTGGDPTSTTCDGNTIEGGGLENPDNPSYNSGGGGAGGFGPGGRGGSSPGNYPYSVAAANSGGGGGSTGVYAGAGGSGKAVVSWGTPTFAATLAPVTFVSPPTTWAGTNWPSAGTYFQGRLWLGGTPNEPSVFNASKSASPEDFTIGTLADDAMSIEIEEQGEIEWIASTKNLLVGTANGEYIIEADQGLIKPGDVEVIQQSAYGSASIQPAKIGDQVMYIGPDKRKLRAMNYEWQQNNWLSKDLTFPSEHITRGLVKDIVWSQHPDNLLWVILKDGTLACLTYERSNNIFGWHRHSTRGKVLAAASGFDGTRSVLILAVERDAGTINIEYLNSSYKLDSWSETSVATSYGQMYYVEGFDHIDGESVQILIDGYVHPDRVVGAESSGGAGDGVPGRVYLQRSGSRVIIGLQYTCELETLGVDGGSPTGSGLAQKKRRNKVYVKVKDSAVPLVNGYRPPDRNPNTPMDTAESLVNGDIEVLNLDWDRQANVKVEQDLPLPLTILSIFGELARNTF